MFIYVYLCRLKAGGFPELPGILSLEPILQTSLWYRDGEWWGGGGVITSCGVRWIQSCGNLEDVASLTMLLRCKYRCCSRSKQLLQKAFVDVKMKKV